VKIVKEAITVIGVHAELSYEDRMDLIRMLSYGGPDHVVAMTMQTFAYDEEPKMHISIAGSFGRSVKIADYAVKIKEEVSA
jgi:hypothetical protein